MSTCRNKATFEQTPLNELKTALRVPVLTMFNVISFKEWSGNLEHSDILILQERGLIGTLIGTYSAKLLVARKEN